MATIGTFKRDEDGSFSGSIKTLTLNVRQARLVPIVDAGEKGPDFRIFAGSTEFGAGWKKTSQAERDYVSVKLDDPSFASPIYATLSEGEDGVHSLIWARRTQAAD